MKIFITGIGTDVGKTVASAIVTQSLEADYWKPIQAGDLDHSDSHKIQSLISNSKTVIHPNAYALNTPASPHWAAEIDGLRIDLKKIKEPKTQNHLVVEGAGGVLVPLNEQDCVLDLIQKDYQVIVVSRHYLGSINHTLLTIEMLKSRNLSVSGIIFSGDEHPSTEQIILEKTGLTMIGRIENEPYFDAHVIADYADAMRGNLLKI
ncbi:dethiobiotin synthase [Flavobacterium sp. CYK-55]|uniref:dethiobiotin synthase n=1 Tax=Flavobacterium sp. CYK-55 TaxID=2835529 RepID=UPI001BD19886|nr:dethiobiotin synthase [Flavobacterium sp. CYK-55]MBS7787808.1 dethiobiotin synthase [Flavobacterium sp. CYK-55]